MLRCVDLKGDWLVEVCFQSLSHVMVGREEGVVGRWHVMCCSRGSSRDWSTEEELPQCLKVRVRSSDGQKNLSRCGWRVYGWYG